MITRPRPSPFPLFSFAINLFRSSSFSSSPSPSPSPSTSPRTLIPLSSKNTNSLTNLNNQTPIKSSNPYTQSILSLLFEPSNQTQNLDHLLKPFKDKLNSDLTFEIVHNYKILGRPKTLEFFSWAGNRLGFRFDDRVVEFMADFLGRRRLFDDLKCLLKTVSVSNGRISTKAISIFIRFLGREGRVLEALALFEMMENEFNCLPDNLVFNNVLYVLCKKDLLGGSLDVALSIFRKIPDPDKYSYSNIIIGLCKFERLENACEVFSEMGRVNLVPTRSAVNVLVGGLCEMSNKSKIVDKVRVTNVRRPFDVLVPNVTAQYGIEPAFRVFWAALKMGVMPSTYIVNELISELCRMKKFDEAVEIVKVVENRKLRCVDESYSIMIKSLCEAQRVCEARDLLDRMVVIGLRPKHVLYNSMIRAYCKLGNVGEAGKLFKIMNRTRCEPDCAAYIMLIHAYCKIQNWEEAYEMLIEMIELGWNAHLDTYNLVGGLLNKYERPDLALKLERKMEIQNICAHCKAGRLGDACDKLTSMLAKGFHLPVYARDTIERAFRKSGKWKIVRDLLHRMDQTATYTNIQT